MRVTWATGSLLCPQLSVWQPAPSRGLESVRREHRGQLCPLKAILGLVSKEESTLPSYGRATSVDLCPRPVTMAGCLWRLGKQNVLHLKPEILGGLLSPVSYPPLPAPCFEDHHW